VKRKRRKYKYINGSKGVISLFLIVILSPALTLITIFTDLGRYNTYRNVMKEVMGVASTSTLANYDVYLQKRFGLYAVDQTKNLTDEFKTYVDYNAGVLGKTATINSANVVGEYSLSDLDILYNQVLEYSKLNAPTTLGSDLLNLLDFIKELENKINGLDVITSTITKGSNLVDSSLTILEKTGELISIIDNIQQINTQCESAYTNMNNTVKNIALYLENERPQVDPDNDSDEDENQAQAWDNGLQQLYADYNAKRTEYVGKINALITNLSTYNTLIQEINSTMDSLAGNIVDIATQKQELENRINERKKDVDSINKSLQQMQDENYSTDDSSYQAGERMRDALESELADLTTQKSALEASQKGAKPLIDDWANIRNQYNAAPVQVQINNLSIIKQNINNLAATQIDKNTYKDGLSVNIYKFTSATCVSPSDIQTYIDKQNNETKNQGGFFAILKGFTEIFDYIFSIELFFDSDLSACINTNFYNTQFGGLPGGASADSYITKVINAINDTHQSIKNLKDNFMGFKLIDALREIKTLLTSIKNLYDTITSFARNILTNLYSLLTGYEHLYTSLYMAYNLPCRTTTSGKTMTGYSFSNIGLPNQGVITNAPVIGNLSALINQINALKNGTGDDYAFSGAELEYIMFGSYSEIANQMYTFLGVYLLRLVLDIVPVTSNAEVQAMAAATTIGYGIVIALVVFLEPLCDTVILVNGGKIPIWKSKIYLTPSGLPSLITNFANCIYFNASQKEELKNKLLGVIKASKEDYEYQETLAENAFTGTQEPTNKYLKGLLEMDYRQYCFLIMAVLVTDEEQIARFSNIVQMESYWHNKERYNFDLRKSYTYLNTSINMSFKQTMAGLFDESILTTNLVQYRGY